MNPSVGIPIDSLTVVKELTRTGSAKQFEERLRSSIEEIGLAEPLKVAQLPDGQHLVIDGQLRLNAIRDIRVTNPQLFDTVPAYIVDYDRRYELRYQTDIYQDLLPSQLATLVEHLHQTEQVTKSAIASYIGVSPATLRNYTGLWRLLQRGGLFAGIVDLMDVNVLPASNPYAWQRLTDFGIRVALEQSFSEGAPAQEWIAEVLAEVRQGRSFRYATKFVETVTDGLDPECYRNDQEIRDVKRDLGLRRGATQAPGEDARSQAEASATRQHLASVAMRSPDAVLQSAARSLLAYLQ